MSLQRIYRKKYSFFDCKEIVFCYSSHPNFDFIMKKDIHPEYKEVVFRDEDADFAFLTRSTIKTSETITWEDGKEYPLVKLEISSASHPFFTGKQKLVDSTGRVERFKQRYGSTSTRQAPKQEVSSQEEE